MHRVTLLLLPCLLGCGSITYVDLEFRQGEHAQLVERHTTGLHERRVLQPHHDVYVYPRRIERIEGATDFTLAVVERFRSGAEPIAIPTHVTLSALSEDDPALRPIRVRAGNVTVTQAGQSSTCVATGDVHGPLDRRDRNWSMPRSPSLDFECPLTFQEAEIVVRYELDWADGRTSSHRISTPIVGVNARHRVGRRWRELLAS